MITRLENSVASPSPPARSNSVRVTPLVGEGDAQGSGSGEVVATSDGSLTAAVSRHGCQKARIFQKTSFGRRHSLEKRRASAGSGGASAKASTSERQS